MRILLVIATTTLASCSSPNEASKNLAQCELDSYGPSGLEFQEEYIGNKSRPEPREDQAYSAFLISCMEARGYKFAAPLDDAGALEEKCWIKDANGGLQPMPWAGGPSCFSR